ncbi:hypothetical protein D3C78_1870050 [compost metagenome]
MSGNLVRAAIQQNEARKAAARPLTIQGLSSIESMNCSLPSRPGGIAPTLDTCHLITSWP